MAKRKPVRLPASKDEGLDMFDGESDRAAAVLGGAYLEAVLDNLLRSVLICDEKVDRLFNNASQKVHLAYALGVLMPEQRTQILALQDVRNYFGHHVLDATNFDNPGVAPIIDKIGQADETLLKRKLSRRNLYHFAVLFMADDLMNFVLPERTDNVKRVEAYERWSTVKYPNNSAVQASARLLRARLRG
jgi:hypothetical protein